MRILKQDKIAEILNKLQGITTVIDICQQEKIPSKKLLRIAKRDLKKAITLLGGF